MPNKTLSTPNNFRTTTAIDLSIVSRYNKVVILYTMRSLMHTQFQNAKLVLYHKNISRYGKKFQRCRSSLIQYELYLSCKTTPVQTCSILKQILNLLIKVTCKKDTVYLHKKITIRILSVSNIGLHSKYIMHCWRCCKI